MVVVVAPGAVLERGTGGCVPLGAVTLEVVHQTKLHRVLDVQSFDADQISGHLCRAFAESDSPIVHGENGRVQVVSRDV